MKTTHSLTPQASLLLIAMYTSGASQECIKVCNAPYECAHPSGSVLLDSSGASAAANVTLTNQDSTRIEEAIPHGSVAGDRCYEEQVRTVIHKESHRLPVRADTLVLQEIKKF
jgi:hypothetical protein